MDLLTVLAHELGHLLGYDHTDGNDLMGETLPVGVRLVPAADHPAELSTEDGHQHVPMRDSSPLALSSPQVGGPDAVATLLAAPQGLASLETDDLTQEPVDESVPVASQPLVSLPVEVIRPGPALGPTHSPAVIDRLFAGLEDGLQQEMFLHDLTVWQ